MHSFILVFIIISMVHCEWHSKAIKNNPVQIVKVGPQMFTLYLVVGESSMISPWKKITVYVLIAVFLSRLVL